MHCKMNEKWEVREERLTSRIGRTCSTSSGVSPWRPRLRIVWCPTTIFHVAADDSNAELKFWYTATEMNQNCMDSNIINPKKGLTYRKTAGKNLYLKAVYIPSVVNRDTLVEAQFLSNQMSSSGLDPSTCLQKESYLWRRSPRTFYNDL